MAAVETGGSRYNHKELTRIVQADIKLFTKKVGLLEGSKKVILEQKEVFRIGSNLAFDPLV